MNDDLARIEQQKEDVWQGSFEDVDPDDESWRDEPEPEPDELDERDALDARMREATKMPPDVQAAIAAGVWEEA